MDVVKILEKMEQMELIRLNKPLGRYYSIYCPIHNDGKEKRPSCGVLLESEYRNGQYYPQGFVHCFSCNWAASLPDTITEILKKKSISKSGLEWLKENIGEGIEESEFDYLIPKEMSEQITNKFALDYMKSLTKTKEPEYIPEKELEGYRMTVPYMYQRGITDELIVKFDVGVDLNYVPPGRKKVVPCITFPVRDAKGHTLFLCRRSIEGKNFYMPSDIVKPVYGLYELPKEADKVIITESCINAITCYRYGAHAVALLGTGTQYQISQLRSLGVKEFILGLDPDEAGAKGRKKLKNALKDIAIVRSMNDIPSGKDINDLTLEEFNSILENRL